MEISQHNMMSIVFILESHRTNLWQQKFHNTSSAYVKKLMDNFAILLHLCNCLPTLHLASQPYMPKKQPASPLDALYKSGRFNHQHTLLSCSKHMDTDFSTFYSDNWNNPYLPRGVKTETHPYLATTISLQCYITTFSFPTPI